jgi:hypothetical protein
VVVIHHGPDVERRVVVEKSHLGGEGGELALVGLLLIEVHRRLGPLPHLLVQTTVDDDPFLDANRFHAF